MKVEHIPEAESAQSVIGLNTRTQ